MREQGTSGPPLSMILHGCSGGPKVLSCVFERQIDSKRVKSLGFVQRKNQCIPAVVVPPYCVSTVAHLKLFREEQKVSVETILYENSSTEIIQDNFSKLFQMTILKYFLHFQPPKGSLHLCCFASHSRKSSLKRNELSR